MIVHLDGNAFGMPIWGLQSSETLYKVVRYQGMNIPQALRHYLLLWYKYQRMRSKEHFTLPFLFLS